jgi:hypothetical protein
MSENEIKYPQRIRGGAGYFPEEGSAILEGQFGATLQLPGGGPVIPSGGVEFKRGILQLVWKRAGSTDHPQWTSSTLHESQYRQIGTPEAGYDTTLEFMFETLVTPGRVDYAQLGSGPNGKGWYFYPNQDFLKPDFTKGSVQSVGNMQIWVNDGHRDFVGGCKWSKNVGSGIDGFTLNLNNGVNPVSENYPRTWPAGTKFRAQINYFVPSLL